MSAELLWEQRPKNKRGKMGWVPFAGSCSQPGQAGEGRGRPKTCHPSPYPQRGLGTGERARWESPPRGHFNDSRDSGTALATTFPCLPKLLPGVSRGTKVGARIPSPVAWQDRPAADSLQGLSGRTAPPSLALADDVLTPTQNLSDPVSVSRELPRRQRFIFSLGTRRPGHLKRVGEEGRRLENPLRRLQLSSHTQRKRAIERARERKGDAKRKPSQTLP